MASLPKMSPEVLHMIFTHAWDFSPLESGSSMEVWCLIDWDKPLGLTRSPITLTDALFGDLSSISKKHRFQGIGLFSYQDSSKVQAATFKHVKNVRMDRGVPGPIFWCDEEPDVTALKAFGFQSPASESDNPTDLIHRLVGSTETRSKLGHRTLTRHFLMNIPNPLNVPFKDVMAIRVASDFLTRHKEQEMSAAVDNELRKSRFWQNHFHFRSADHAALFFEVDLTRIYQIKKFWFDHSPSDSFSLAFRYLLRANDNLPVFLKARVRTNGRIQEHVCKISARPFRTCSVAFSAWSQHSSFIHVCMIPLNDVNLNEVADIQIQGVCLPTEEIFPKPDQALVQAVFDKQHFHGLSVKITDWLSDQDTPTAFRDNQPWAHQQSSFEYDFGNQAILDEYMTKMRMIEIWSGVQVLQEPRDNLL